MKTNVDCRHCGKTFERTNPRNVLCSSKCKHDSWYAKPENKKAKYERSAIWKSRNYESLKHTKMKCLYGITLEVYRKMNEDQGGVCKICKRICPSGRELSVDHCHKTGKVRGLLCMRCNKALGLFNDDIPNILASVAYLEESK